MDNIKVKFGLYARHFAGTYKIEDQRYGVILHSYVFGGQTYHVVSDPTGTESVIPCYFVTEVWDESKAGYVAVDLYEFHKLHLKV